MTPPTDRAEATTLSLINILAQLKDVDREVALELIRHARQIEESKRSSFEYKIKRENELIKLKMNQSDHEFNLAVRAQWFAITISIASIIGGTSAIIQGHDWAGAIIAGTGAGLVGAGQFFQMARKLVNKKVLDGSNNL